MTDEKIYKLFPEPIFQYKLKNFKNLNDELSKYIYGLYDEDTKGVTRSNKGGWHSKNFVLGEKNSIQTKFAVEVQKYILKTFQHYGWKTKDQKIQIQSMWAIINKKDDFNVIHTHPNCFLSAAYYVKAPEGCGRFKVEDPNNAKRHLYPAISQQNELNVDIAGINIEEGDLLFFPSYLPHKVGKNESEEDRIVISFNIDIK